MRPSRNDEASSGSRSGSPCAAHTAAVAPASAAASPASVAPSAVWPAQRWEAPGHSRPHHAQPTGRGSAAAGEVTRPNVRVHSARRGDTAA